MMGAGAGGLSGKLKSIGVAIGAETVSIGVIMGVKVVLIMAGFTSFMPRTLPFGGLYLPTAAETL